MATTYSATEVLAETNLLPKKIEDAIRRLDLDRLSKEVITSPKVKADDDDFVARARASYQSVNALFDRHLTLKRALIRFNSGADSNFKPINTINVLGVDYTVAELLERKKTLDLYKTLLYKLEQINLKWEGELDRANREYQSKLEIFITNQQNALGQTKRDETKVVEWTASFSPTNQPVRLDPIGLIKEIDRLREYIDSFSSKLDVALSRLNATGTVTID